METMWKRAQTATEYLIILAVVIIIALIVVGVMGGIPGIGGGASSSASTAFWKTASIGIESLAVAPGGNINLTIRNNMPNTIKITDVYINETVSERDRAVTVSSAFYATDITLATGETQLLTNGSAVTCTSGETVILYFKFTYQDMVTSAVYTYAATDTAYEAICTA